MSNIFDNSFVGELKWVEPRVFDSGKRKVSFVVVIMTGNKYENISCESWHNSIIDNIYDGMYVRIEQFKPRNNRYKSGAAWKSFSYILVECLSEIERPAWLDKKKQEMEDNAFRRTAGLPPTYQEIPTPPPVRQDIVEDWERELTGEEPAVEVPTTPVWNSENNIKAKCTICGEEYDSADGKTTMCMDCLME